ncbi:GFA family protein [Acinetobacter sp. 1207_04]|uniref:GFA family protein n=1 Tax=Acinetobacter sp. 1207_04 TaxID=2604449 RepID=UPI00405A4845
MSEEKIYTGSCLCGAIRYEIHGEIGEVIQCHCKRCRKANGTAFATNAPIKKADFKIVQGEHLLKKFASTPTTARCFCSECASPIISIKAETPDTYRLRIGTLDTPLEHKPVMHIFTAYKAEWDTISDGLPQYDERP